MTCLKCSQPIQQERNHYGLHERCFLAWFDLTTPAEFTSLVRRSASKEPQAVQDDKERGNSSFFQGKFRKYSADLNGESYIFKVREDEAPELPDLEYMSNQIGAALDVPLARFYTINFQGDRIFVTKNFIDKKNNADLKHIHLYQPELEPRNCENLLAIIYDQTRRFVDIETFIQMCLFDGLIGNHDRHGRNLGFIVTPEGSRLAPIYDNPSALGLEKGEWLKADFEPKGRIPTSETNEPTLKHYVREFVRLGYEDQVVRFFKKTAVLNFVPIIDASYCSELMKQAMKKLINKRLEEFKDEMAKIGS